jgi:hypothetical protein
MTFAAYQRAQCTASSFLYFSFQLHDNALALHEYTRHERKKAHNGQGDGFDGELDNFQQPELSSLERLVCLHHVSFLSAH